LCRAQPIHSVLRSERVNQYELNAPSVAASASEYGWRRLSAAAGALNGSF